MLPLTGAFSVQNNWEFTEVFFVVVVFLFLFFCVYVCWQVSSFLLVWTFSNYIPILVFSDT